MKIEVKPTTPVKIKRLIFSLLDVFQSIDIPLNATDRTLERMAKACLAVGKITKSLKEAESSESGKFLRTRDIIEYENRHFKESLSPGSYDDIRRKDLKLLVEAGVVVNSSSSTGQATNNPSRGYALSPMFVRLISYFGSDSWSAKLDEYKRQSISLKEELLRRRNLEKVAVTLPDGSSINLSFGEHNNLQKAIVEELLPRYGMGAKLLYLGDTSNKFLFIDKEALSSIKFFNLEHEELPDVIAYAADRNLLFLIEAYHSTGEWSEVRLRLIKDKLIESGCTAIPIFFTAFNNKNAFRQKSKDIAWETEVWIADNPDHLIHFNGYKFLEIHK